MTATNVRFGHAIRHFRAVRGWSQEMLAERANLNRSYLGEVERGIASPSLITAGKLAHALGMRLSHLVDHFERSAERRSEP